MNQTNPPVLEAQTLSCAYANDGQPLVLSEVDLRLYPGELVGLIGPNGAGKTTLLRALARLLPIRRGRVLLDGHDIWRLSPKQIARQVGRVPQSANAAWPYRVEHVVRMGRYPHLNWLAPFSPRDAVAVNDALARLQLLPLRDRPLNSLSGGEQQRVLIARALAQEPNVLLLDEPIANLDINHQLQVLALVQTLVREQRLAVLLAIHDLELAARYCDRLVLLAQGGVAAIGRPTEVLQEHTLRAAFKVEAQLYRNPAGQWALSVELPDSTIPDTGTGKGHA